MVFVLGDTECFVAGEGNKMRLSSFMDFVCVQQKRERPKENPLFVVQGGNTRKDLSFQEFQRGTSSSGDVAHVSGTSRELSGGNGVSSSDNGDGTLLLGKVGQDVDNSKGSLGELFEFKDSHGSIHDDSLAFGKGLLLFEGGLGTVVKSHPTRGDGIGGNELSFGILGELVGNDNVAGEKDLLSELFGLGHDLLGGLNKVVLDQRGTNLISLGFQESENHATSNDDDVALVQEGLQDCDLGGDLGSTDDSGHWLLSVLDGSIKVFELLSEEESRHRGLEELGDTFSGSVGTVGGSERVIDVNVERGGELLNKAGLVLLLLLVESGVLEHDDITLLGLADKLHDLLAEAVGGQGDGLSEELSHALGAGGEGILVLLALGASQVRADSDDGSLAFQVLDGGDGCTDTGVISDRGSVQRDVHIATNQNLLSLEFLFGQVFDGLLRLEFEDRWDTSYSEGV
jgi:hypothetical protein